MSNYNLDTQTPYLWVIFGRKNSPLTKDFKFYYEKLVAWCKINARLYCLIGHDKDLDEDNNPKFRHIHALIVLKEGVKPRLSTSLNRLSEVSQVPSVDIDIQKSENITECIRYCIHRGYPLKHQYLPEEMITNLNKEDLDSYLNIQEGCLTATYLINLVQLCNFSVVNILKQIGLKNYCRFRNVIQDLIKELNA